MIEFEAPELEAVLPNGEMFHLERRWTLQSCGSLFSCCLDRRCRTAKNAKMARTTNPPTTPPMIAGIFEELDEGVGEDEGTGEVGDLGKLLIVKHKCREHLRSRTAGGSGRALSTITPQ